MLLQLSSLGYILSMCCLALFNAIWSSSSSTFKAVESSHFMVHESGGAASYANKDDYTITGLCYALLDITELLLHKKVDICAAHVEIYSALITSLSGHQTNLIHFLQPIKSCFFDPRRKSGVYFAFVIQFRFFGVVACFCNACELQNMLISVRCCCCTFEYFIKEAS